MDQLPEHVLKNKERQKFDSVKHKIRIMQAFVDGRHIICKSRETLESSPDRTPSWNWETHSYMIAHDNYSPRGTIYPTDYDTPEPVVMDLDQRYELPDELPVVSSSKTLDERFAEIDREYNSRQIGFWSTVRSFFS